jgi:hypothetical protein
MLLTKLLFELLGELIRTKIAHTYRTLLFRALFIIIVIIIIIISIIIVINVSGPYLFFLSFISL